MRVQPVSKGQPTFTNSNPRPLFKGQLSNKNNNNISDVEEKEFQRILKEMKDFEDKHKETNTGLKGTKKDGAPQMPNVSTPLKPQHKIEDPNPNPKSTTPGKLNFIA